MSNHERLFLRTEHINKRLQKLATTALCFLYYFSNASPYYLHRQENHFYFPNYFIAKSANSQQSTQTHCIFLKNFLRLNWLKYIVNYNKKSPPPHSFGFRHVHIYHLCDQVVFLTSFHENGEHEFRSGPIAVYKLNAAAHQLDQVFADG